MNKAKLPGLTVVVFVEAMWQHVPGTVFPCSRSELFPHAFGVGDGSKGAREEERVLSVRPTAATRTLCGSAVCIRHLFVGVLSTVYK